MGLVGHAGGLGWDEVVLIALPVAILAVLQVLARRKAARDAGGGGTGGEEGDSTT